MVAPDTWKSSPLGDLGALEYGTGTILSTMGKIDYGLKEK